MTKLLIAALVMAGARAVVPTVGAEAQHLGERRDASALEAKGDQDKKKSVTDAQIRAILIEASIAAYSGNCPCPYSVARNGSRCGRRSAYSREGGAEPLCYPNDVSAAMVKEYRESHPDE